MDGQIIRVDLSKIHGSVYKRSDKGVYYVKIHIPDLDLYITSITVRRSSKYAEQGKPWVQMPKFPIYNRWIAPLEFPGTSLLKQLIEDEVLRAYDRYLNEMEIIEDTELNVDDIFPP